VGHIIFCIPATIGVGANGIGGFCVDRNGVHLLSGSYTGLLGQIDVSFLIGYYRGYGADTMGNYHITDFALVPLIGPKAIKLTDTSSQASIIMVGVAVGGAIMLPYVPDTAWRDSEVIID
jgi:hypothetical protein